jgi:serine/threonine protein kinase
MDRSRLISMKKRVNFYPQKDMNIGNKYLLKEFLDEGSFGYVWEALNLETGQIVALKIPKNQERGDNTLAEGREFIGCIHPNVICIYWMGRVDGVFVIEMEYYKGHKLSDELCDTGFKSPRTFNEVYQLYLQILEGVEFIHSRSICHGDIKPQNILIGENKAKITDFGTSKLIEDLFIKTVDGGGTWAYLAPEVAGSNKRYLNSDIYALGVLLYKLVTGRTPHETANQVINNIPYPKPGEINNNISEALEKVILKALERNPLHRYKTVSEVKEELFLALKEDNNKILSYNNNIKPQIEGKSWIEAVISFYKSHEYKKAELMIKHEIENGNKSQDVLYHMAYTCYLQKSYYESLAILNNININLLENIRIDAFEDNILYLKGKVLLELKRYDEAIVLYRKLVDKNPDNIDYRYKLACVYGLNNEEDRAIDILEKINKEIPGLLYIVKKLGHAYDQKREYGKARGFFTYALRLDPNDEKIIERLEVYKMYQAGL